MPERQIPWRLVASRLGGRFQFETGVRSSRFHLQADVDGIRIKVEATSAPYARDGGNTKVRALASEALGAKMHVVRNVATVPLHRRFLMRDVLIGAPIFDERWIINSRREAHAQAFLNSEICALIESVPSNKLPENYLRESGKVFYDYSLGGRQVTAYSQSFESDPDRLGAAVTAAVALAKQPQELLKHWHELAIDLDGKFEHGTRFRLDGSTRIRFPLQGRRVVVSPRIVSLGWRRDRLRTRITCEYSGGQRGAALHWHQGESFPQFGTHSETAEEALTDAEAVLLRGNHKLVEIELDGNVTDAKRIIAAGSLAALLSRGNDTQAGPYR
jgi:hypothetical protein